MRLRRLLAPAALAGLLSAPAGHAAAQTVQPAPLSLENGGLALQTLGHSFHIPLPDWLVVEPGAPESAVFEQFEALFAADARQALLQLLPRGEVPSDSPVLYAARITLEPERQLSDYRNTVMFGYAQTCQASLTGFFQLGPDAGETLAPFGFVCGGFFDRMEGLLGRGQVMVMSFKRTERGIATVYQEWRGRAFDPGNPATWPVPAAEIEARAHALQDQAHLRLAGD